MRDKAEHVGRFEQIVQGTHYHPLVTCFLVFPFPLRLERGFKISLLERQ